MKQFYNLFTLVMLLMVTLVAKAQPNAPDIVVSKDGKSDFASIQEAIMSVRDYKPTRTTIYVKRGTYNEKVLVPANKCDITIIGEDIDKVKITYSDFATLNNMGMFNTWTCRVDGSGIRMENLTIENAAGRVGQAVCLHVEGDRCEFTDIKLIGNQSTLFNGGTSCSRQYFKNCYIEGTTDFISGPATVWFEGCTIMCKSDSYITAASTPKAHSYGMIFSNCVVKADKSAKKVYLGRPWREYASVTFMNCELPSCLVPEGWHNWGMVENQSTARFSEYHSTGVGGAVLSSRVKWATQLDSAAVSVITLENVMKSSSDWAPVY